MSKALNFHYEVDPSDFARAGETSSAVKKKLSQLGFSPDTIRRTAIAMYEGEINMVIHAGGGEAKVDVDPDKVVIVLTDHGPGIADVEKAMQEGWSTATEEVRGLGFGAGMGLPNIKKYADVLDIKTTVGVGTTLTLKFFTR